MKRSILFLFAMFVCLAAIARRPGYADYKQLSAFGGDTVAYLDYNWSAHAMGTNSNAPLQEFLTGSNYPSGRWILRVSMDMFCLMFGFILSRVIRLPN